MSGLSLPANARSPWQRFFTHAHERRRRRAQRSQRRLPHPVISVGNLHLGGTGKTPLVLAIARHLGAGGARVVILSRGYRRRSRGNLLVSDGGRVLVGPEAAGDEPFLLASALPGVAVVVGGERLAAGALALERLDGIDLFLLDDGFSHVALARDVELLAFPVADPFGGGRLLPSGRLREPLSAARFADAVLLTGLPESDGEVTANGRALAESLAATGFRGPGFDARLRVTVSDEDAARAAVSRVVLVSGVARPAGVAHSARAAGLEVARHLAFPDHHAYPRRSLRAIRRATQRSGARAVATTSKDVHKLAGRLELPLIELRAEALLDAAFYAWLDERVARVSSSG